MLFPHPGHIPASPNCTFHCLFNIIVFFLIWSFDDFPTKISPMARDSECKTQNNCKAQWQVAIGTGKFHRSFLFYLKILVLYKHTSFYCTWLYCASQMLHFLFLTNWRQGPPPAKRLALVWLWYLFYCGGLALNLQYRWGMPVLKMVSILSHPVKLVLRRCPHLSYSFVESLAHI